MDITSIIFYISVFSIISCGLNLKKWEGSFAKALMLKGIAYIYLAFAILVNILNSGNAEKYVTGLTLGIAIVEGSTAIKSGIEKVKNTKRG